MVTARGWCVGCGAALLLACSGGAPLDEASAGAASEAAAPIHRYGFEGDGTVVRDAVGGADGTVAHTSLAGDGALRLSQGAHVELPGGLLSELHSASLELWVNWEGDPGRREQRIFDFGAPAEEGDTAGQPSDFFLSPSYDEAERPHLHFRDQSGQESQLLSWRVFPSLRTTHVVVVLDGDNHEMTLYLDGEPLGSTPWNQQLGELRDETVWLGRSLDAADPGLSATFDEFRIYDRALASSDVARNHAAGPDGVAPSDETGQADGWPAAPPTVPQ